MLDVVCWEVRANDVTAVVPHVGDISEEGLPSYLTSDGVLDVVLDTLIYSKIFN